MGFNQDPDAFDQSQDIGVGNLITVTHLFNGSGTTDVDGEVSIGRIVVQNHIGEIVHVSIRIDPDEFNHPGVPRNEGGARAWDVELHQTANPYEFDLAPNAREVIDYSWRLELKLPDGELAYRPFLVGLIISATASLQAQKAVSDEHLTEVNSTR